MSSRAASITWTAYRHRWRYSPWSRAPSTVTPSRASRPDRSTMPVWRSPGSMARMGGQTWATLAAFARASVSRGMGGSPPLRHESRDAQVVGEDATQRLDHLLGLDVFAHADCDRLVLLDW